MSKMPSIVFADPKFRTVDTWLGPITYVGSAGQLLRLYLPTSSSYQMEAMLKEFPRCRKDNTLLDGFADQLQTYFAGTCKRFSVPVYLAVSDFTAAVLHETRKIPFGQTVSYKDITRRIGRPRACRAVGNALAANPLPLVVPCHRVISTTGKLGGFTAGIDLKRKLLAHENRHGHSQTQKR